MHFSQFIKSWHNDLIRDHPVLLLYSCIFFSSKYLTCFFCKAKITNNGNIPFCVFLSDPIHVLMLFRQSTKKKVWNKSKMKDVRLMKSFYFSVLFKRYKVIHRRVEYIEGPYFCIQIGKNFSGCRKAKESQTNTHTWAQGRGRGEKFQKGTPLKKICGRSWQKF